MKKHSRLLNTFIRALNGKKPKYRGRKHVNAYTKTMRDLEWSRMHPDLSFPVYRRTINKSRIMIKLDKGYIKDGVFSGFTEIDIDHGLLTNNSFTRSKPPELIS